MTDTDSSSGMLRAADPKALGFGVYGLSVGVFSLVLLRVIPGTGGATDGLFTLVTYALLVAGIVSFLRAESWHGTFFLYWSVHSWRVWADGGTAWTELSNGALLHGWFIFGAAVFNAVLLGGAVRRPDVDLLSTLVVCGATVTSCSLALVNWGVVVFGLVGGAAGVATGLLALVAAATAIRTEDEVP